MKLLLNKPYFIFWASVPVVILFLILSNEESFVFNIYDTYYVMMIQELMFEISVPFVVIGMLYWLLLKFDIKLSKRLNFLHIMLTYGGIALIIILNALLEYYELNSTLIIAIYIVILIALVAQLLFPINAAIGIIKKWNNSRN